MKQTGQSIWDSWYLEKILKSICYRKIDISDICLFVCIHVYMSVWVYASMLVEVFEIIGWKAAVSLVDRKIMCTNFEGLDWRVSIK